MKEQRIVNYRIDKKGRKYWTATYVGKPWTAQIVIDDLTSGFEVGQTYRFLADVEKESSYYGTKVTVTAVSLNVPEETEAAEARRSVENIVAYIEKKASDGKWHEMGETKLAGFDSGLVSSYLPRIEAAREAYEKKAIASLVRKIEDYAANGFVYTKGIADCEALHIAKYPDLMERVNAAVTNAHKQPAKKNSQSYRPSTPKNCAP
ncbi:MAG: hypothetical protein JXK05_09570 [Campylobacterales bacterium]|nr:hypothetical protein [Campylobacterales bacterium]